MADRERGRPTKLTEARMTIIIGSLQRGDYKVTAAALAEVHPATIDRWLERGEHEDHGELDPDEHLLKELREIAAERQVDIRGLRTKKAIAGKLNAEASIFSRFSRAYKKAYAEAESLALGQAVRTGREDWRFWMTYLERTRPQRWGRRQRLEEELEELEGIGSGDEVDAQRILDQAGEIRIKMLGTGSDG